MLEHSKFNELIIDFSITQKENDLFLYDLISIINKCLAFRTEDRPSSLILLEVLHGLYQMQNGEALFIF